MSRSHAKPSPPPQSKTASWRDRLSQQDYNQLRETFLIFDEDGSGTIDPNEINKVLEELGLEKRNPFILSLIHGLKDKNKPITLDEFMQVIGTRVGDMKTKEGLKRIFALYDKNGDGIIDYEEFKDVARWVKDGINNDDLLEMLHSNHVNHLTSSNQGINFQEFERIVGKFNNK